LFIATSLQLLLPVIETFFFSVPRFSIRRNKIPQKLNVIFLDQNRRNFTAEITGYTVYLNQRLPGACNLSPASKLLSKTTQLHCGSHLGGRA
jgi:hypothetical protein